MFRRKEEDAENEQLAFGSDNDNQQTAAQSAPQPAKPATEAPVNESTPKPQQAPTASAPAAASSAPAPSAPAAAAAPSAPSAPRPAAAPATSFRPTAPTPAPAPASPAARASQAPAAQSSETRTPTPAAKSGSNRILTVGANINMNGEINSCDRLIIEGIVDATLRDVHTVELAETGSLNGTAEVQDAEISGHFEGDLVVTGRLIIYSTGSVRGNITYGEIEIERGGQLSGNIAQSSNASAKNKKAA